MNGDLQNSEIQPAAAEPKTIISTWVSETVDGSAVHGVENELMVLQKMLGKRHGGGGDGDGFRAIGIVGVGGIGKSTICQAFLQNPEVKSKFLPRIWVSMSTNSTGDDPDPKIALVKRILISLGVEKNFLAAQTLGRLLYALRLQLRGKSYLIVLDDAKEQQTQEEQEWYSDLNHSSEKIGEKLRDGFPKGGGGAVIVTSRSERAAKLMVGDQNLRCLVAQKDPESFWEIFRQQVENNGGNSINNPSNLKELKVELLKKCGGLPLAAKMMGQIKLQEENKKPEV
ncbi:probable disease resistance protein At4g19060 [Momordica charantia]|uniref:Probable disease resistance protein At4g19060 n=1 Tax=Momordica charantia TaxID=3673 RepID=A0A6J1E1I2_MOMCH|nr:probable disease resistance protein At4g19060 [Momordica charantia]